MPEQRRRFSPQFKAEAVQMVIETGKPIAEVARDLGIHDGTLAALKNEMYHREHFPTRARARFAVATTSRSSTTDPAALQPLSHPRGSPRRPPQPHRGLINNPRNCPRFLTRPNNRESRGSDHDDRWPEVGTIRDG